MWRVFVVQPTYKIDEYRKLARVQNERNKTVYHYECTVYDLLKGLRMEHDALFVEALKKSRTGDGVSILNTGMLLVVMMAVNTTQTWQLSKQSPLQ